MANRRSLLTATLIILVVGAASQWWAGSREQRVGEQVAAMARPGDIRMLSSDTCAICRVARAWFDEHRVAYSECSIERDAACRADFESTRAPGTPVIVVRGKPLLGFDPERLRRTLESAG